MRGRNHLRTASSSRRRTTLSSESSVQSGYEAISVLLLISSAGRGVAFVIKRRPFHPSSRTRCLVPSTAPHNSAPSCAFERRNEDPRRVLALASHTSSRCGRVRLSSGPRYGLGRLDSFGNAPAPWILTPP